MLLKMLEFTFTVLHLLNLGPFLHAIYLLHCDVAK